MNLRELMEAFVRHRATQPVMVSPGNSGGLLHKLGHREPTQYNTSMAYAAPSCFGLALARPDLQVVAIEGDGSMIAGLSFFTTLARYPLPNLVLLVVDNTVYLSTDRGKLPTAARWADLAAIAKAAGVEKVFAVSNVEAADTCFARVLSGDEEGPFVIVAKVELGPRESSETDLDRPDRTEASMAFRRWMLEHANESGKEGPRFQQDGVEPSTEGPGRASARIIHASLKESGVDLVVYLPDSVLYPVQELAEADPQLGTICCSREDEGVAIASGAYYGGLCPALVIEGSGIGYSGLALASSIVRRTPTLLLASHSESLGVRFDHDTTSRLVNEPTLRALGIPYEVLHRVEDAPALIRESVHEMLVLKHPVGIVVPPHVMSGRGLSPRRSF